MDGVAGSKICAIQLIENIGFFNNNNNLNLVSFGMIFPYLGAFVIYSRSGVSIPTPFWDC